MHTQLWEYRGLDWNFHCDPDLNSELKGELNESMRNLDEKLWASMEYTPGLCDASKSCGRRQLTRLL
jgi:hypothetical protein